MQYINAVDFTQPRKNGNRNIGAAGSVLFPHSPRKSIVKRTHISSIIISAITSSVIHDRDHYFYILNGQGLETEFKYFDKSGYFWSK